MKISLYNSLEENKELKVKILKMEKVLQRERRDKKLVLSSSMVNRNKTFLNPIHATPSPLDNVKTIREKRMKQLEDLVREKVDEVQSMKRNR